MTNPQFKSGIFKFSNKLIFHIHYYNFFNIFFKYIEMSKDLSTKHYQENKERLQKKLAKEKKEPHGREHYKNLQERQKQKLFEYRKKYYRVRKSILL